MTGGTVDLHEDREGTAGREPTDDEGRFRLLIDGVEDCGIILLDPSGGILTWNTGAERLTGYRADEVLGRQVAALQTPGLEARGSGEPSGALAGNGHAPGWQPAPAEPGRAGGAGEPGAAGGPGPVPGPAVEPGAAGLRPG